MKDNEYKYHQYIIVGKPKAPILASDGWDVIISDEPLRTIEMARNERRRIARERPSWNISIIKETVVGKEVR